ncbi:MAG: hypothetical protein ACXWOH_12540 [Bdellovibrionota bacterium]
MLTLKRIVAALILWAAADLVAMGILTTMHVVSVQGRPSPIPGGGQLAVWLIVSLAVGIGCFKLSWAKIK